MIVRGRETIYPVEIENQLLEPPTVKKVAVLGLPHERCAEEVAAVVHLHPGQALLEHRIGGVAQARVNMAGPFDIEQGGGTIRIGESEPRGLVNRVALAPVAGSGWASAWSARVSSHGYFGPAMVISCYCCDDPVAAAAARRTLARRSTRRNYMLKPPNLVSKYSSMPSRAPSRPSPLSFMPPKGAAALVGLISLMPMMPNCRPSKLRMARERFRV
jgi:hypothetical protein